MEPENDDRSSTASHFSKVHETASSGTAEHDLFGVHLNNDLTLAHPILLVGLLLLLVVLVVTDNPKKMRRELSVAYWLCISVAVYILREVTLVPLLTTIVFTRTSYPYLVVIPHCIVAAASYRSLRGPSVPGVQSFAMGFFCWGFGGSIVSDVLMGLPATALGHHRIIPCYVLGWICVWYSPFDIVYRWLSNPDSVVRKILLCCESIDVITTPMGRISRSARELQNKTTAPLMAGLFAGVGGGMIRFTVLEDAKAPLYASLEQGVWRTLGYSVLWWWLVVARCQNGSVLDAQWNHCSTFNGAEEVRVAMVIAHVAWTLLCDMRIARGHPTLFFKDMLRDGLATVARTLHLGPQLPHNEVLAKSE